MMAMHGRDMFRAAALMVLLAVAAGTISFLVRGIPLADPRYRHDGLVLVEGIPESEGIHEIDLDAARVFIERGLGAVLDARPEQHYAEGHLPGAELCHVYEIDRFLPDVLRLHPLDRKVMVYCSSETCGDAAYLARSLRDVGYLKLYVFRGGFSQWLQAELPVEKDALSGDYARAGYKSGGSALDPGLLLPVWFWLSLDVLLLALGLSVAALLWRSVTSPGFFGLSLRLVGLLFIVASLHKIAVPQEFARAVDNYRMLPWYVVNIAAMIFPWIELLCGVLLLTGFYRAPAAALTVALTAVFILAIGFNLARELEFDCGCLGSGQTSHWQVLARDIGIILICLPALIRNVGVHKVTPDAVTH